MDTDSKSIFTSKGMIAAALSLAIAVAKLFGYDLSALADQADAITLLVTGSLMAWSRLTPQKQLRIPKINKRKRSAK